MRSLIVLCACVLSLALLAGCVGQSTPAADVPKTTGGVDEALIVYERSGGLVGGKESWSFFADGKMIHTTRGGVAQSASIKAEEVAALVAAIDKLGFSDLKESYLSNLSCRDCYRYTVSLRQADGTLKQVETQDAEPEAPLALTQIIEQISLAAEAAK